MANVVSWSSPSKSFGYVPLHLIRYFMNLIIQPALKRLSTYKGISNLPIVTFLDIFSVSARRILSIVNIMFSKCFVSSPLQHTWYSRPFCTNGKDIFNESHENRNIGNVFLGIQPFQDRLNVYGTSFLQLNVYKTLIIYGYVIIKIILFKKHLGMLIYHSNAHIVLL